MAKPICSRFIHLEDSQDVANGSNGFKFRFISYNILAQVYVKSSYFQHSPSSCLKWKARSQAILMDFKNFDADFLCTQEYQANKTLHLGPPTVGIWTSAQLLQMEEIDYNDLVNCMSALNEIGNNKVLDLETRHAPIKELSRKHQPDDPHVRLKRDCVGLLAAFQLNDSSNHIIVVANTHIYWDPNWADIKLAQAKYLLSRLSQFKELISNKFTCIPSVLVAGDFNSTPGDEVYRYLVSASEVAPIQLRSLYAAHGGEPTFTNCTPDFTGTLDYIFLSGSRLRAVSLLEMPGPESADVIGGLPNHHHPSDHLPIGADFSVLQSP
ncbi:Endonuclease/Exonuclease/phosphatase family [Musa troglodytarum]|uniref:Endonuclease/Exonuclease/phosphatase family n=1 Tax=Musa troglodytarum TaxID=320322 RepID=A0A9E7GY72_9LILI|nr:Endonuclease/Exonuclease/phosphatase family [Musa troglodytarum]URE23335.1 Endonuclease/Exonuclease/phosphatase family [Musa troglodytarum]